MAAKFNEPSAEKHSIKQRLTVFRFGGLVPEQPNILERVICPRYQALGT
jgi:hypothetical protein